jgi:hypothetical protein
MTYPLQDAAQPEPNVRTFHFVTSAQVALDARTLMNARLIWLQLVTGIIILLIGVALAVGGASYGWFMALVAALVLAVAHTGPGQRWLITRNSRSLLGRRIEVTVGPDTLRFAGDLATTEVRWSSLTAVLSNERTVVFMRDRVFLGYLPASAFASAADQAEFVRLAQERVAGEARVSRG